MSAATGCGGSDNGVRPVGQSADGGGGDFGAPGAGAGVGANAGAAGVTQCPSLATPGVLHPLPAETYSAPLGEPAQASADCGTIGNRPAAVAPTPTDTQLALLFGVISDTNALDEYAMQVSDPSSPLYHHYLTSAQIAAMFGPSECNSKALIAWAQSHGLSTEEDVSGFVDVGGTIAQLNEALNVTFENYQRYDGSIYYAPDRQPSIDSSVPLLGVSGLDNCYLPIPANADQPEGQPDAGSAGSANM